MIIRADGMRKHAGLRSLLAGEAPSSASPAMMGMLAPDKQAQTSSHTRGLRTFLTTHAER